MGAFCRDCLTQAPENARRCAPCGSPRLAKHPQLDELAIAHVDCDAFYATIEKRDNPALRDQPLIVGGGVRGVVTTACYIARTYGVRSAMPMFKARALCPQAAIVKPDMGKYVAVGRQVRELMFALTPLVEPVSIDEAFMDLSGTARLHGISPARSLAKFAQSVEREIGISISVGLSGNKFLAKIASDLAKPRGFSVIAPHEAAAFLAPRPVSTIFGVGGVAEARLAREGFRLISDIQALSETEMTRRYGPEGTRLHQLAHGIDARVISAERETKSVSAETTFNTDIADEATLQKQLWPLAERVAARMKAGDLAGNTVTLKLKSADFKLRTRARSLPDPTQLASVIFEHGRDLLAREADGTRYRLIGIGVSALRQFDGEDPRDLVDRAAAQRAKAERAVDKVRAKFGRDAVVKGFAFGDES